MAYRKIHDRLRYRHCKDIGVNADYCILEFKYAETGWRAVATCHPAAIGPIKRDGIRKHAALVKMASGVI